MVDTFGYDKKQEEEKTRLSKAIEESNHHIGYNSSLSPNSNVRIGYEKHKNYAHVFKELNGIANLTHNNTFMAAAKLAHEEAIKQGDYDNYCKTCGKSHKEALAIA